MVFARAKLVMEDNCFEEEPGNVEMAFVGQNVSKLYEKIYELMKSVFHVVDSDIQETSYSWGKSDKGDKFSVTWWVHRDMDLFSYWFVRVKLAGQGDSRMGNAKVQIRGLIRSEYPQDTVWQRSLFYEMLRTFWHRAFYRKKRELYAEDCRHSIVYMQTKLKEFMGQVRASAEE
ncbi:MAG: hypothetical protein HY518_01165 [Candidatus Aenigmarchaeota archaeon]|nr:hypothetical protein [Candidatus Aenigmarchaeota archaeon]